VTEEKGQCYMLMKKKANCAYKEQYPDTNQKNIAKYFSHLWVNPSISHTVL
jgi:hypothetical protein